MDKATQFERLAELADDEEIGDWAKDNRDLIARALRRDQVLEVVPCETLEKLAQFLNRWDTAKALKDPGELRHVLDAIREVVQ